MTFSYKMRATIPWSLQPPNVVISKGSVVAAIARSPDGDGDPATAGLLLLTN